MSETQKRAKQRFTDLCERHLHWGSLRTLGINNRLVTSSIAWIFIVPIAAKLLAPFAGQHTLNLSWFDEPITATIALPFSWQRFYFMSWFFVIAKAVYWLACPEIVRRYANFGAYRSDHASDGKLREFIRVLTSGRRNRVEERIVAQAKMHWASSIQIRTELSGQLTSRLNVAVELRTGRQNEVFDILHSVAQYENRFWSGVSGVFFVFGLVLLAWVVVEGVVVVCKLL